MVYVHAPDATLPPPGPLLGTDSLRLHGAHPPAAGDLHAAPLPAGTFVFTCNCVQHNFASVCVFAPWGYFRHFLFSGGQGPPAPESGVQTVVSLGVAGVRAVRRPERRRAEARLPALASRPPEASSAPLTLAPAASAPPASPRPGSAPSASSPPSSARATVCALVRARDRVRQHFCHRWCSLLARFYALVCTQECYLQWAATPPRRRAASPCPVSDDPRCVC